SSVVRVEPTNTGDISVGVHITTEGVASGEGFRPAANQPCESDARYSFSAFLRGTGVVVLSVNDGAAVQMSSPIALQDDWHSYGFAFSASRTGQCSLSIATPSSDWPQRADFWASGLQMEPAYASSQLAG